MKLLITGGAGFIGSNFVHYMLSRYPDYEIINVDALTYAGNPENLRQVEKHPNYTFVKADIADQAALTPLFESGIDAVINFAAESHVDRSILQPGLFVHTNIVGTQTLLDLSKTFRVQRYVQVSTDEVYGTLGAEGLFTESTPLAPNSPYSASKAGADLLVRAYHETYGLQAVITRCSNNYGPYQFPEKLIPLMILNALQDKPLPVYGDGLQIRDWLYVEDHCKAIDLVLHRGRIGEVYNVGGSNERTNLQVVQTILQELGKPASLIRHVQDRPGHDRRYAIDANKIKTELGWTPEHSFEKGIASTIAWYLRNEEWLEKVVSGAYMRYYDTQYAKRLESE
ncbi:MULTISPECIES: dTDP-glucose 4,6-dehydratase [unclassified Paenibacillus]|uniref:dTDP-glucose 4,6-dehydratase n=1 Tax=unclassified Paenibacillus TaxID=185978 RepID=UPI00104FC5D4|nr:MULTISPECIES: dTDP-glucose 4,6-dehydratase [unclassified Paenibacillus]NIK70305.1 dTDP-glucose 4,6-dehydratase [Paenibacillus sp. BK720]TCM90770.1 dTDP-glucose 4,6-dehydratase [Paenibacillus sp. BK033]